MDIWRDIFDWFSPKDRKQLALKFNGIVDREFSQICQKWLHEWAKNICIGELTIDSDDGKMACMRYLDPEQVWPWPRQAVPFADAELPENIRGFKEIDCSFLDTTVLQFLRRMQPLFRNVNLEIHCSWDWDEQNPLEAAQKALALLMPLLTGGIQFVCLYTGQLIFNIWHQFPAQFFAIKQLEVKTENRPVARRLTNLLFLWLSSRRHMEGQPRVLILSDSYGQIMTYDIKFVNRIRKLFLKATIPVSFFIWISHFSCVQELPYVQESSTKNIRTGEQLEILMPNDKDLLIGRCSSTEQLGCRFWVEEMFHKIEEANRWRSRAQRKITIADPTFGPDEEAKPEEKGDDDDDDCKPGPSKKTKLASIKLE